jgi:hypothetical protein
MYRLDWLQSAVNELTDGWLEADAEQRSAISAALREIELHLERDPLDMGESRANNRRVGFAPPLSVFFSIDERMKIVTILHVRVFKL